MKSSVKPTRIIGCMLISVPLCFCSICFLSWWSFPPTEFLARLYLDRVIAGDSKGAASVAYFHRPSDLCDQSLLKQDAIKDIAQFGGAEIKNLTVSIFHGKGSDENYETATMTFEYRKPNQAQWLNGKIRLESGANYWGIRFICDNMMYDHPYP